ncbi:membrane-associated zinc metalloprotease [Desulforapulum autotrophicum HRM2]|uniref:Zinc metalloprotease n=1 Tax=Desulforapulum autotrophicum (strain ATCC 43914 / DSM 3382 / VKM B-1955 / HRM2) TaxID=177437 RepID=C0QB24_DESAH|nr:RIP metalloprotease RseP [Desulforapulum autotrophicum]ACN14823.1 membrane-associated zinc metalloprotease [Desulforapulum autotrophicum HRM2]
MGHSLVAFVVVLGVLIFFHELGHFLVARFFGVGVETFSLGFGPKIYRKKIGLTEYCLSIIPLGGYVKMVGEDPSTQIPDKDRSLSFTHKRLYQKSLIVAAGPIFNFVLAVLIFYVLFQVSGSYYVRPVVGTVADDSPALSAGVKPGDLITAIDGVAVESWDEMVALIGNSRAEKLDFLINRSGQTLNIPIVPEQTTATNIFGESIKKPMIGISSAGDVVHERLNPVEALVQSFVRTWEIIKLTLLSVGKIFTGSVSAKSLGGPIMIAQMAGQQAEAGMANLAFFIAMLSINLGIINLFPVPVLDGGHLLFFGLEALTGKPAGERLRERANQFGIVLLLTLMVFVFYNDILRIFNGE